MKRKFAPFIVLTILILFALACGLSGGDEPPATDTPKSSVEPLTKSPSIKATPTSSTPEVDSFLGDEYRSEAGGYSLRTIPDYELMEEDGFLALIAPDGNPNYGPMLVFSGETPEQETTLDEFYDEEVGKMTRDGYDLSPPENLTIGGVPARGVNVSGMQEDVKVEGRIVAVLISPQHTFIMGGMAPADRWEGDLAPLFEAVLETIEFFEPTGQVSDATTMEMPEVPLGDVYSNNLGGYKFRQLPGYSLDEREVSVEMVAPQGNVEVGPAIFMFGEKTNKEMTLDELYDSQIQNFASEGLTFGDPRDVTIGGAPARSVDVSGTEGDVDMAGRIVVVLVAPQRMFLMAGIAPQDRWDDFVVDFEALQNSIEFFEPGTAGTQLAETPSQGKEIRQWAKFAFASSEFTSSDWSAMQATGAPDTFLDECADATTAWASFDPDTVEWIELQYETPVIPTEINIIQTHSPDQVVKVELVDMTGAFREVYSAVPRDLWLECPYTLTIPLDVGYEVAGLKITLDQSVIAPTWNEIDAVELVGFPAEESKPNGESSADLSDLTFTGHIYNVGGDSIVSDEKWLWSLPRNFGFVEAFDPNTHEMAGIYSLIGLPGEALYLSQAITYDGTRLWIASGGSSDAIVQTFDPQTDPSVGELSALLPNSIHLEKAIEVVDMTYDGNLIWVAVQRIDVPSAIVGIDPVTLAIEQTIKLGMDDFVTAITSDGRQLWVSIEKMGNKTVHSLDPDTGELSGPLGVGGGPLAYDGTLLWVGKLGTVWGVDTNRADVATIVPLDDGMDYSESLVKAITFDGLRLWVLGEDAIVWYLDLR